MNLTSWREAVLEDNRKRWGGMAGYLCDGCEELAKKPQDLEADHITPIALGGENTITNGQMLCKPCHRYKTEWDVAKINIVRDFTKKMAEVYTLEIKRTVGFKARKLPRAQKITIRTPPYPTKEDYA